MDLKNYLQANKIIIDAALDQLLPSEDEFPSQLHKAMRYCLMASGKRIRPILALAAAEAVGGNPEAIIPESCALELIHTFTLIHDDLPAMDDDDYRRGILTTHKVYGEAMAILAGDALLTEAFNILALGFKRGAHKADHIVEIIKVVADASGSKGIVGGQVADLESEGKLIEETTLEYIHNHKTGSLITASVILGGTLAGGSEEEIIHLENYGNSIGLAFQIKDDILDIKGSSEEIGKKPGSDENKDKATYPRILGLDEAEKRQWHLYLQSLDCLKSFDTKADRLREIGLYIIERTS
jgi:geranylgeranyl diphosphate synthase type II